MNELNEPPLQTKTTFSNVLDPPYSKNANHSFTGVLKSTLAVSRLESEVEET